MEEALREFGFPDKFVLLVTICISAPKFSIKFSGVGHGYFDGKRGIVQGDPISPLFVLAIEYLSRVLKR